VKPLDHDTTLLNRSNQNETTANYSNN